MKKIIISMMSFLAMSSLSHADTCTVELPEIKVQLTHLKNETPIADYKGKIQALIESHYVVWSFSHMQTITKHEAHPLLPFTFIPEQNVYVMPAQRISNVHCQKKQNFINVRIDANPEYVPGAEKQYHWASTLNLGTSIEIKDGQLLKPQDLYRIPLRELRKVTGEVFKSTDYRRGEIEVIDLNGKTEFFSRESSNECDKYYYPLMHELTNARGSIHKTLWIADFADYKNDSTFCFNE
jgi:hypothetical protein